jgi:hypothetical protein
LDYADETLNTTIDPSPMSPRRITITINITNDDIVELTETFNATFQLLPAEQLSLTYMSITTATFVILDDDGENP